MEPINSEELDRQLQQGICHAAYLLLGPEEFLRRRALLALRARLLEGTAPDFLYEEYQADRVAPDVVIKALRTLPMIGDRRIVVLAGVEHSGTPLQDAIKAYLQKPAAKSTLVMTAVDLDRRTGFCKVLTARSQVVEFPRLRGPALAHWVEEHVRRRGYRIAGSTASRLVALAGPDLQGLVSEVEKVLTYAGDEKVIAASMVDSLVLRSRQHSIFELTDAMGRRDRQAALRILNNLIDGGEPVLLVLNLMARHLRQLLIAKEMMGSGRSRREIAQAVQVPSFVLEEFLRQARGIEQKGLEGIYIRLAEIDRKIKSTSTGDRLLLESLVHAMPA